MLKTKLLTGDDGSIAPEATFSIMFFSAAVPFAKM